MMSLTFGLLTQVSGSGLLGPLVMKINTSTLDSFLFSYSVYFIYFFLQEDLMNTLLTASFH